MSIKGNPVFGTNASCPFSNCDALSNALTNLRFALGSAIVSND